MELKDLESAIESILFASGEPVPAQRIGAVLGVDTDTVFDVAEKLKDSYSFERRGIRLVRLDKSLQLCSAPENAEYVRRALETRKPPQLSQSAMEVLAIVAYYQPATKAYVEQVRGVDSSYTIGVLLDKGLIEACGRLAVPGRPVLYATTKNFLRAFSLESIDELPPLPELDTDSEGQMRIENAIQALQNSDTDQAETGE